MCNRKKLEADLAKLAKRFQAGVAADAELFTVVEQYAFDHSYSPLIKTDTPNVIEADYHWGLVPEHWNAPKETIWNSTYNAKIEYLTERASFKNITNQRCIIPVTSYFEYHWNDAKGKTKTLYEVTHPDAGIFALAGLYSTFQDYNGEEYKSYTVLTTEANERMRWVHNKDAKKDYYRMPIMLNPEDERSWLDLSIPYMDFAYPNYQPRLIAEPFRAEPNIEQLSLF